jgi:hypothetical protein
VSLSIDQLATIKSKVLSKIMKELELADKNDSVDEFMEKYGIVIEEEAVPVQPRTMKILVLGSLAGRVKDYQIVAKKCGVPEDNIEFISDYDRLKGFSLTKLENSNVYSDVIYGPNPHKQVDMGDKSSMLAEMMRNPARYPRVIKCISNDKLKISISGFRDSLSNTRYMEAISE